MSFHFSQDPRAEALYHWSQTILTEAIIDCQPASSDAGFRRYFRLTLANHSSLVVMDAPPDKENCAAFIKVNSMMQAAGVHVPTIHAQDLTQGFLLLSDAGRHTYLDVLNAENADQYMQKATQSLLKWQCASKPDVLQNYDAELLRRELQLFPDWYITKHKGFNLSQSQADSLQRTFALIIARNMSNAKVYVHRDYMPRNLMATEPMPCVLDHQDAVYGSIAYDIASLCADAFISWEEPRVLDWSIRYWEQARKLSLPVPADFADFYDDIAYMALQRHLKILGIFARINYRDGKPKYLADTPRFINYVRKTCQRYSALAPLLQLLTQIEGDAINETGYTF